MDRQAPPPPHSLWSGCEAKQHRGGSWLGQSKVVGFEDSRQAGTGSSIVYKELEHGVLSPTWEHLLLGVNAKKASGGPPMCPSGQAIVSGGASLASSKFPQP